MQGSTVIESMTESMIESIEERVRADVESDWPEAEIIDRRANVGFSDGKTTSYTIRIHTDDGKFALTIGPQAVRKGDGAAVIEALDAGDWIERLKTEGRLLVELEEGEDGEYVLGPRPDSIVL